MQPRVPLALPGLCRGDQLRVRRAEDTSQVTGVGVCLPPSISGSFLQAPSPQHCKPRGLPGAVRQQLRAAGAQPEVLQQSLCFPRWPLLPPCSLASGPYRGSWAVMNAFCGSVFGLSISQRPRRRQWTKQALSAHSLGCSRCPCPRVAGMLPRAECFTSLPLVGLRPWQRHTAWHLPTLEVMPKEEQGKAGSGSSRQSSN